MILKVGRGATNGGRGEFFWFFNIFWKVKKSLDFGDPWVKFLILDAVLIVFSRKNSKLFHCTVFLSCVIGEVFIEVPLFQETSFAMKQSWLRPW